MTANRVSGVRYVPPVCALLSDFGILLSGFKILKYLFQPMVASLMVRIVSHETKYLT